MRRLAIVLAGLAAVLTPVLGSFGTSASAASDDAALAPPVDVVQISGFLDRITVDEWTRAIERAETGGAQALIVQLNSKGAVVPAAEIAKLATRMQQAKVPVAVWVGPSGARAQGEAGQLLGAAAVTGMAPGTRVGRFGAPLPGVTLDLGATGAADLRSRTVNAAEARGMGIVRNPLTDETVPTLRNMLLALNGLAWEGRTVQTTQQVTADDGTARIELIAAPRLFKIGLVAQLMHSVASVPVAYLLITIGLCLLLFEFFTAGIGVAGVVGAVCAVLGCYGLVALPTRGWAVALLVASILAFAIDVQTGVPRFWTGAGMVLFTVASLFLYRDVRLSWLTLLVGIAGVALTFFSGMPSMVRTRFATPTIGREWMIGAPGEAVTAVDPEGTVKVGEGQWRARTNRATPVEAGGRIRVVAIDGVTLEVEPEEGAARDYRERRGSGSAATPSEETRA